MTNSTKPTDTGKYVAAEVKSYLDEMAKTVQADMSKLSAKMSADTEALLRSHEATRRQVVHVTRVSAKIWRAVMGNVEPPRPPSPGDDTSFMEAQKEGLSEGVREKSPSLVDEFEGKIGAQQGEIDELRGQLLAVKATAAEVLRLQREQMGKKDPNDKKKDKRSSIEKLVDGFLWVLKDREGQKTAGAIVAGITGILTAAGTWYALMTGRLPMPNAQHSHPVLVAPDPPER